MVRQVVQLNLSGIRTSGRVLPGKRRRRQAKCHQLCSSTGITGSRGHEYSRMRPHDASGSPRSDTCSSRIRCCHVQRSRMCSVRRSCRAMKHAETRRAHAPSCSVHRTRTCGFPVIARLQQSRACDVAHTHRAKCRVLCRCHDDRYHRLEFRRHRAPDSFVDITSACRRARPRALLDVHVGTRWR